MIVLIILGCLCVIIGLIGCVIPGIAGFPFSFLALVLLSIAKRWEPFSSEFLIGMGALTVGVTLVDYFMPAAGAKKSGASRAGFWGAFIGMWFLVWDCGYAGGYKGLVLEKILCHQNQIASEFQLC